MRVIVVGAGEVGSSIAANLSGTHDVVVIDSDPGIVEELSYAEDVLAIEGDGTDPDVLADAGVGEADMLIASTDDDETNIVACGVAAVRGDPFTIARVKRPKYLRAWEPTGDAFDVDFMVCTDLLAAETIVGIVGHPTATDVDTFAGGAAKMAEFAVPEGSPVAGATVREADRFDELTFAAVVRDDDVLIAGGATTIEAGDELVVIGTPESVRSFGAEIAPQRDDATDVVVVGGSEVGYQTARLLEEGGYAPRLIERDADRARWLAERLPKTTVMESDATDQAFLERENVGRADAVVATLENEQQNLLATLLAKRLGAERAIAVVDSSEFTDLFEAVGVDVAVSPRQATAEEITRFTRARRAENVAIVADDRAEVLELAIDDDSVLAGRSIGDADEDLPEGVVVGAIIRNGTFVTPRGDTVVEAGDHVVLFTAADIVDEVAALV